MTRIVGAFAILGLVARILKITQPNSLLLD